MHTWKGIFPNALTLSNLALGCVGIVSCFQGELLWATWCILLASLCDFLDGLVARLLGVSGELGKQLDSLADAVTFGVLPGIIQFQWISIGLGDYFTPLADRDAAHLWIEATALILPLCAIFRLARFNLDTRQTDRFIGVPTPAVALLVASFALIMVVQYEVNPYFAVNDDHMLAALFQINPHWQPYDFHLVLLLWNPWFHVVFSVVFGLLMISPLPLLSFKFKSLGWKANSDRYGFLIVVAVCLLAVILPYQLWFYIPYFPYFDYSIIPIILLLYIVYSLLIHLFKRNAHEVPGSH